MRQKYLEGIFRTISYQSKEDIHNIGKWLQQDRQKKSDKKSGGKSEAKGAVQ